MLSTALNSNALNVAVGFLLPAAVLGIGPTSDHVVLVSAWYVGLTLVALTFAYFDTGLRRDAGYVILASYLAFCAVLIATSHTLTNTAILLAPPILIVSTVCILYLHPGRNQAHKASTSERQDSMCVDPEVNERARPEKPSRSHEASLVPTWSVNRLALLALILLVTVAAVDAVLGRRICPDWAPGDRTDVRRSYGEMAKDGAAWCSRARALSATRLTRWRLGDEDPVCLRTRRWPRHGDRHAVRGLPREARTASRLNLYGPRDRGRQSASRDHARRNCAH